MITLETPVAFFRNHRSKQAKNRPIVSILEEIRNGNYAAAIRDVRQPGLSKEERGELKRALPAIMVSGTSTAGHKATDFDQHSGLLQIDIDGIGEDKAATLRDAIGKDPHILAAFVSPSGNGVKAFICIPAMKDTHAAAFAAAAEYIRQRYGLAIDPRCKDITRICYVSHDPELVLNADAVELDVAGAPLPDCEKGGERRARVPSLPPLPPNSSTAVCYKLHSTLYTLQQGAKIRDFTGLDFHFDRHVTRFFAKPSRGYRNEAIVQIAAKLFYVVKPEFVLLMLQEFKHQHQDAYADYDGDFDGEAVAMVKGLLGRYPSELNEAERTHYLELPQERQTAFRICRSLANCESDPDAPRGLFFLSREGLAHRLGQYGSENAKWIFHELEKRGVIEMVKKGTARRTGHRGEATTWRWLLSVDAS